MNCDIQDLTVREAKWLLKWAMLTKELITLEESEIRLAEVVEHVASSYLSLVGEKNGKNAKGEEGSNKRVLVEKATK